MVKKPEQPKGGKKAKISKADLNDIQRGIAPRLKDLNLEIKKCDREGRLPDKKAI